MRPSIDSALGPAYSCRPFVGTARIAGFKLESQAHETHVSAQQSEARPHARLPCPYGDQGRPARAQAPPREGPRQTHALIHGRGLVRPADKQAFLQHSRQHRFSRQDRLPDSASFSRVFQKASRSGDEWFTVLCRSNNQRRARLGLAISKKSCNKAARRNRIKRIVRESFRRHRADLGGVDVVVMARPAAAAASNAELFASLDRHWQRLHRRTAREGERRG